MFDAFWAIVLGGALIMFGLRLFFAPRWYAILRDTYMDFSDHHHFWGIVWIFVGCLFIWMVIRQKKKNKDKRTTKKGAGSS